MKKHFLFILMTVCCMILGARHLSAQNLCNSPLDYQGYKYHLYYVGGKCWMRENLRATQYADGSEIPDTRYYNDEPDNLNRYGLLYTYYAATQTDPKIPITQLAEPLQGVCPNGWHLPSQSEWEALESSTGAAGFKSLLSSSQWLHSIGTSPAEGFNIPPGGYYNSSTRRYERSMSSAFYCTSTVFLTDPLVASFHCHCPQITTENMLPSSSFSVRCVSDIRSTVTTTAVLDIGVDNAKCSANVTSEGSFPDIARGFCWNTSPNPTIENLHSTDISGSGTITSNITGLTANTTYYVRAYATNSMGTSYGNQEIFTTLQLILPTVTTCTITTSAVTNITGTTATCGGNVTFDGNTSVTARGVCWSTSQNPTNSNNYTTDGSGTGAFTSNLTNLTAGTIYYVRAYVTNSEGTSYGEQKIFVTGLNCPSTLTDRDGNTYNTVQIGNQCWMKENLRTTKYADGTFIDLGSSISTTIAYRYNPNNDANNVNTYGYLYNWKAVMRNSPSSSSNPSGVQGICPTGWHVPSNAEWSQLINYVRSKSDYTCSNSVDKALASTTGWASHPSACSVGNNPSANNATGFSALPAGHYYGYYDDFGLFASYWSATEFNNQDRAYYYYIATYSTNNDIRKKDEKSYGWSVRCLSD